MELLTVKAKTRTAGGKGPAKQTRREGSVPSVLYGGGGEPVSLVLDSKSFEQFVQNAGQHAVLQLDVEDQQDLSSPAMLKEVQHHPVRGQIVHADFLRIRLDEKIQTVVSIVLVGRSKGVIEGGLVDHQMRDVEIECLAIDVPEQLELDITDLDIGDGLHVSDLVAPADVKILTDPQRSVVAIHAPRVVEEEVPEEGEEIEGEEGAEAEGEGEGEAAAEEGGDE
jgi:large subunit ribosomal protein L25